MLRIRLLNLWVMDFVVGVMVFSCVRKSYNGVIGMEFGFKFCGMVFEVVKWVGYKIGLVVMMDVMDVMLVCFVSYVGY